MRRGARLSHLLLIFRRDWSLSMDRRNFRVGEDRADAWLQKLEFAGVVGALSLLWFRGGGIDELNCNFYEERVWRVYWSTLKARERDGKGPDWTQVWHKYRKSWTVLRDVLSWLVWSDARLAHLGLVPLVEQCPGSWSLEDYHWGPHCVGFWMW